MPSVPVPTEPEDYLLLADPEANEELLDILEAGTGSEQDLEELGLEENLLDKIQSPLLDDFMKQSQMINNVTDDDLDFLQCFHKFLMSMEDPSHDPNACPVKFDGVSCWPETPPGNMRAIPCFEDFNGVEYEPSENNATLYCRSDGNWSRVAFYGHCLNADVDNTTEGDPNVFLAKNTIFYVGYTLSLVAVLLALWIFISLKDLRCLRNTIHTNLLFTYLLHATFWIVFATIRSHVNEEVGCSFIVTLQYLIITNFMWMFVEGFYLYMLVVKTFEVESIKLRVYTLVGWGIPVPIIIIWVLLKSQLKMIDTAQTEEELEGVGLDVEDIAGTWTNICPLMAASVVDWVHKVAVLILLSFNIFFLLRIMWVLITKLRSANNVETRRYKKATKALLVLTPLLGITYLLVIDLPNQIEHVHAILQSTQGFWVAILYCFVNSEVQNSIRQHFMRWKTERGLGGDRHGSLRQNSDAFSMVKHSRSSNGSRMFGSRGTSLSTDLTVTSLVQLNGRNSTDTYIPDPNGGGSPQPFRRLSKSTPIITVAEEENDELRVPLKDSDL